MVSSGEPSNRQPLGWGQKDTVTISKTAQQLAFGSKEGILEAV